MILANCLHCKMSNCEVDISEYPKSISVICPMCGSTYLHKNDVGVWETSQERMDRMKKTFICKCGKENIIYADRVPKGQLYCDSCNPDNIHSGNRERIRKNPRDVAPHRRNSPWHIGFNLPKKKETV